MKLLLLWAFLFISAVSCFAQEPQFSIYGFFDLEYEIGNKDDKARKGTFDQHHFNVISSFVLDERFRVLGEIEWEHGFEGSSAGNTGELRLERAWLEYKRSDALKIRAGKYLTPYGIYNIRHDATPTFLSTFLPSSIYGKHLNPLGQNQRLYAKFSSGLQVLGTLLSDRWKFSYIAYLSNGQGANAHAQDDNANKALGIRIKLSPPVEAVDIGFSFYNEVNGQVGHTRQQSVAIDGSFGLGNALLQSEAAFGKLERVNAEGVPSGTYQNTLGTYGQVSYLFFDALTPFYRYEFYSSQDADEYHTVIGVNYSVTHRVYLKSEVHFVQGQSNYELFVSSVAVAF